MNTREYIESGVLELYIFNQLSEAERKEVEAMCAQYPEVLSELEAIQASINGYATSHIRNPDPALKEKILSKLDLVDVNEPRVIAMNSAAANTYRWLAAASVALFITSSCGNLYLYNKYQNVNGQLADLQSKNSVLANNNVHLTKQINMVSSDLIALSSPSNVRIELSGLPISPAAKAIIFWDKERNSTYINTKGLPPIAEGKQYQLWAIVDGKPVDMGVLPLDKQQTEIVKVKDVAQPQAFAITVEPAGGSVKARGEMIVIGKL